MAKKCKRKTKLETRKPKKIKYVDETNRKFVLYGHGPKNRTSEFTSFFNNP